MSGEGGDLGLGEGGEGGEGGGGGGEGGVEIGGWGEGGVEEGVKEGVGEVGVWGLA